MEINRRDNEADDQVIKHAAIAEKVSKFERNELEDRYIKQEDLILAQADYILTQETIIEHILGLPQLSKSPPIAGRTIVFEPMTGRVSIWDGVEVIKPFPQNVIMAQIQTEHDKSRPKIYDPSEAKKEFGLM